MAAWYGEEPLAPEFAAVIRRYTAGYTSGHWQRGEGPRPGDICVGSVANTGNHSYWFVRAEDAHLIPADYRYLPQFSPTQSYFRWVRRQDPEWTPELHGFAALGWQEPQPFRSLTDEERAMEGLLDPARG